MRPQPHCLHHGSSNLLFLDYVPTFRRNIHQSRNRSRPSRWLLGWNVSGIGILVSIYLSNNRGRSVMVILPLLYSEDHSSPTPPALCPPKVFSNSSHPVRISFGVRWPKMRREERIAHSKSYICDPPEFFKRAKARVLNHAPLEVLSPRQLLKLQILH